MALIGITNVRDRSLPEGYVRHPEEGVVPMSPAELAAFDCGELPYPANPADFYGVYEARERLDYEMRISLRDIDNRRILGDS